MQFQQTTLLWKWIFWMAITWPDLAWESYAHVWRVGFQTKSSSFEKKT